MKTYNVCIIGGGAAGLAAAASFDNSISVCILENNRILGRKVMATGGGRCNITNDACENKAKVLDFFSGLGLATYKDEEGRYYPYSNYAPDVVKVLENAIPESVDVITEFDVRSIDYEEGQFVITGKYAKADFGAKTVEISAENVILAAGGKAAPQFGSIGDGHSLARQLGHSTTTIYPILTGIECSTGKLLKGIRAKGRVMLLKNGNPVKKGSINITGEVGSGPVSEIGEIQFTEDGISGICVFNITPYIKAEEGEDFKEAIKHFEVVLDLAPDFTQAELINRESSFGILTTQLAKVVDIKDIKYWRMPIKNVKGWREAQCTGGGVDMNEINEETMESKLVPGLFFAGEIIDRQGLCGGFNLQNAWETGIIAAESIKKKY